MIFIDANIFLAYANTNDVHHARAVSLMKDIELGMYGPYFTSDYVFNEVIGVTFRKSGKEKALVVGKQILKSVVFHNVDEHFLLEAWKLFADTSLQLNLVDCTNISLTKAYQTEYIATFDKEFQKIKHIIIVD